MSFHQITAASLTPSRPAPQAPQRRGTDGPDMYTNNTSLANSGYSSAITFSPSPPANSSYSPSYSGIGGSPNRQSDSMSSVIVRSGSVSLKEDGTFASWMWKAKWLVLKEQTLSIHKAEVSGFSCSMERFEVIKDSWTNRAPLNKGLFSSKTSPMWSGQISSPIAFF